MLGVAEHIYAFRNIRKFFLFYKHSWEQGFPARCTFIWNKASQEHVKKKQN